MQCREFIDALSDYLEGLLVERDEHRLRSHLDHCPECRLLIESARQTLALMGTIVQ